jgi:SOS-response transcriptional repressor LexA
MLFMAGKQVHTPKWPNGLAAALARVRERDPEMGPTKIAKLTQMNKQTVDRYIKGERKLLEPAAEKLAPIVHATVAELVLSKAGQLSVERVPLISWVAAGKLSRQEGITKADIRKHVSAADLPKGDWVALEVSGDSMNLIAPHGAIIFVNRADERLVDDAFYVFQTPDGETFKRWRGGKPPRLQPYSTNPDHETQILTGETSVFGRVRRVIIYL